MAVAMTLALSSGEIDLSVGAVAGLASVTTALAVAWGGLPAGIMTGITVGLINGFLSTRLMIPTFLTALAMMGIAKGTAMLISGTAAIPVLDRSYPAIFGSGNIGPIPTLLLWMLVIGHVVLRLTKFGRQILAVGGNIVAARFSGINTGRIKLWVIVISVISAVVLGGTSLFGGNGTVLGSIIGAPMIGVFNNGLNLMGLEYSQQLIAPGGIIILAVALSQAGTRPA
jgi:ribose transport system permease protein